MVELDHADISRKRNDPPNIKDIVKKDKVICGISGGGGDSTIANSCFTPQSYVVNS